MKRRIAIVALVIASQLFSWGGSAVYLCVAADGSLAIDFGPANCNRCQHSHDDPGQEQPGHDHHGICRNCCEQHQLAATETSDHDCTAVDIESVLNRSDCDCKHIQISRMMSPAIARNSLGVVKTQSDLATPVAIFQVRCMPNVSPLAGAYLSPECGSAPPIFLAVVVLRC